MRDADPYVTLICSLPSSERLFRAKKPPLSRYRLQQRLKMLDAVDRAQLELVEYVVSWDHLPGGTSDAEVIARGKAALRQLRSEDLRRIVQDRLELRTALSALRRRAQGQGAPAEAGWGYGRYVQTIQANWSDAAFGLTAAMPWLPEAARLQAAKDPLGLERLVLRLLHKQLSRIAARHQFDLEAVVIYVLQWHIFDRWARSNAEAAARRFEDLTRAGLGDFADIRFEGERI